MGGGWVKLPVQELGGQGAYFRGGVLLSSLGGYFIIAYVCMEARSGTASPRSSPSGS